MPDIESEIRAENGKKRLQDVEVGDCVLSADGYYRKVVKANVNTKPKGKQGKYVKLSSETGDVLIVSPEHRVAGKPASEYKTGDFLEMYDGLYKLTDVSECSYKKSGDMMLEDGAAYVANGFIVNSMIASLGLENYEELEQAVEATVTTE